MIMRNEELEEQEAELQINKGCRIYDKRNGIRRAGDNGEEERRKTEKYQEQEVGSTRRA